jgi:hypothetical protein
MVVSVIFREAICPICILNLKAWKDIIVSVVSIKP